MLLTRVFCERQRFRLVVLDRVGRELHVYGRKVLRDSTVVGAFALHYVFIMDYITVIYFNSVVVILNMGSTTGRITTVRPNISGGFPPELFLLPNLVSFDLVIQRDAINPERLGRPADIPIVLL
jgi:hypothetical protein